MPDSPVVQRRTYSVDLIQDLPLLVGNSQLLCRLDGASQLAGPNLQVRQVVLLNESLQCRRELSRGNVRETFLFVPDHQAENV